MKLASGRVSCGNLNVDNLRIVKFSINDEQVVTDDCQTGNSVSATHLSNLGSVSSLSEHVFN